MGPEMCIRHRPGAERLQYNLLEKWNVGRAVRTVDEAARVVNDLLVHREKLDELRKNAASLTRTNAAENLAMWLQENICRKKQMREV